MSIEEKNLVKNFFESDFYKDTTQLETYLHPKVIVNWSSSAGHNVLNYNEFAAMATEMGKSFEALNCEVTHLLQENNFVTIRFSYTANTIEEPDEDIPIAHFIAIWEIKDQKLYKGFVMSQPGEEDVTNLF